MSEEEVPLQALDADSKQQSNISASLEHDSDPNETINDLNSDDLQVISDPTDTIQVINDATTDNTLLTVEDETQNLLTVSDINMADSTDNDYIESTENDYVDVTVESNPENENDNDSKEENDSNHSNKSYIVIETMDITDKIIISEDIKSEQRNLETNIEIIEAHIDKSENEAQSPVSHNQSVFSIDSIGSEPMVTPENEVIKARCLTTWVPINTLCSELTVIAGDIVTILHSEPVKAALSDNPLALSGDNNAFDKVITLNTMHWTQIRQRSGKIGVVPSNILGYDDNPVNDVWIKVKMQHSYSAKTSKQMSVHARETVHIFGIINEDDMITAKRKDGVTGLVPYSFVEIPPAQNLSDALRVGNNASPQLRSSSMSSMHSNDYADIQTRSQSRNSSIGGHNDGQQKLGNNLHQKTASQLKFSIDDTITHIPIDSEMNTETTPQSLNMSDLSPLAQSKKSYVTNKIKAMGASISTAIDKIQYASYSHGINKSLNVEPIPIGSNLTSPSGKTKSYSATQSNDRIASYEWSAKLQWRKVYIIKDFTATHDEIERVYQLFILDKVERGRNESILSYSEQKDTGIDYVDPYNAAMPSKAKKTEKDCLKVTTKDSIEITGDPSPEGWVLARVCKEKDRKGFVPLSFVQEIQVSEVSGVSGIGALLEQHNQLSAQQRGGTEEEAQESSVQTINTDTQSPKTETLKINTNNDKSETALETGESGYAITPLPRSKQPLPFHWPFSSYNVRKRGKCSRIIESAALFVLWLIYLLPIMIEQPKPENAPKKYNIWWVNLWVVFLPWTGICLLRMLELWTRLFASDVNPNNKLYATLLFYIVLIVLFFGLFAIVIEVSVQYEWIKDNSPVLLLAMWVEILVFIGCVGVLVLAILFILIWTFCCRITRNRWETRIEFYCCTRGEAVKTKRYPRGARK